MLIDTRMLKKHFTLACIEIQLDIYKNCRIGVLMFQTVFYPGFSKQNITSVVLRKKIRLADKSDNHVL